MIRLLNDMFILVGHDFFNSRPQRGRGRDNEDVVFCSVAIANRNSPVNINCLPPNWSLKSFSFAVPESDNTNIGTLTTYSPMQKLAAAGPPLPGFTVTGVAWH